MLEALISAWRARRVLVIGGADALCNLLALLGASVLTLPLDADAASLFSAMTSGRVSAVFVAPVRIARREKISEALAGVESILHEAREAGVPQVVLLCDETGERPGLPPFAQEMTLGGSTRGGLLQSLLQLYADGISRGLDGESVRVLIVRHAPVLGGGHPAVRQIDEWMRDIRGGQIVHVAHPDLRGVFCHPLDIALGALCLSGAIYIEETPCASPAQLGVGLKNICPNRTAAVWLSQRFEGSRPIVFTQPPHDGDVISLPMMPSAQARHLQPVLDWKEALAWQMELLAADDAAACRQEQAERFLRQSGILTE